jgi:uncharacterized protein (TIRG00374 family)
MAKVGVIWLAGSLVAGLLSLVLRAVRWRFLLAEGSTIPTWSLLSGTFIGMAANNILPARMGEVIRAWVFSRREGRPAATVLASILVERLLDVVVALVIFGLCLFGLSSLNAETSTLLKQTGIVILVIVVSVGCLLVVIIRKRQVILRFLESRTDQIRSRWIRSGVEFAHRFLNGLQELKKEAYPPVIVLSFVIWFASIVSFYVLAQGFGLGIGILQTTLVFIIVLFGVAVPSAPGFVGTFHGFCVAGLSMIAGTEPTIAAAYATVLHGSQWFAVNLIGLSFFMTERSISWTGLTQLTRPS